MIEKSGKIILCLALFLSWQCLLPGAPEPIARVETQTLTGLTENLCKLAESVSPGSSIKVAIGLAALSFDPKYKDFDLSGPLGLYFFDEKGANGAAETTWLFTARKKGSSIPTEIDGHFPVHVREMDGLAALSPSDSLLDRLGGRLPARAKTAGSDAFISFSPSKFLGSHKALCHEIRTGISAQIMGMSGRKASDLKALKALQIKMDHLEGLLGSVREVRGDVHFRPDSIRVDFSFTPVAKSAFEGFIMEQEKAGARSLPELAGGRKFALSGDIVFTEALRKGAAALVMDMAMETSDTEKDLKYADYLEKTFSSSSGPFVFYSGSEKKLPYSVLRTRVSEESAGRLGNMLESFGKASEGDGLRRLRAMSLGQGESLCVFSAISGNDAWIVDGFVGDKAAAALLDDLKSKATHKPDFPGYAAAAYFQGVEGGSRMLFAFKDGSVRAPLTLSASLVREMIPQKYLGGDGKQSAPAGGGDKKGRKSIRINPSDFKR